MRVFRFRVVKFLTEVVVLALLAAACSPLQFTSTEETKSSATRTPSSNPETATFTFTPDAISPSPTGTQQPSSEPKGCLLPSDDYTIITVNDQKLNQRTYDMLVYAQSLYGGQIDITGSGITQGSYTSAVEASFGTHAGGGAVDLSVMAPGTYTILYEDIEPLVQALRLAGFAAWYRDFNDLYEGSPPHIHAIAIGDRELSLAAREQLAGTFGYFWGYDGLPRDDGIAHRDPHGGPIICDWMMDMGYPAKTATPRP